LNHVKICGNKNENRIYCRSETEFHQARSVVKGIKKRV
jgi:hypothetical protein